MNVSLPRYWPLLITHFNTKLFIFLDWVWWNRVTTWPAVTLHSSPAITQTTEGNQAVFHWMRSIACVLYALRPFFSHLMYFVLPESSCILLKIKCQSFQAVWGYFICLLLLLLLLKYHSPLWTLASNTALFHSFQLLHPPKERCRSDISQILSCQGVDLASLHRRGEGQAMDMQWNFNTPPLIVFTNNQ